MQAARSCLRVATRASALQSSVSTPAARTGIRAFANLALKAPRSPPPDQSMRPHKEAADLSHSDKWLSSGKSPMEMIADVPPIALHQRTAVCYGGEDPALGHPVSDYGGVPVQVEYIMLDDTSVKAPATCKYCGLRYFEIPHH